VAGGTDKETAFIELDPCLSGDAGTPLPLLQGKKANHRTLSVDALPWKLKVQPKNRKEQAYMGFVMSVAQSFKLSP
jgi:hypothetical protein